MAMMENEYHKALRIPSAFDLLLFKKKLTVTGTKGNTQGVSTANKPVIRQSQKLDHREFVALLLLLIKASAAFSFTVNCSSPLGKLSPCFPSQVIVPFTTPLSVAFRFNGWCQIMLSVKNLISLPPSAASL